jgi:riboflavin biosynthesis pyrimidine reductase
MPGDNFRDFVAMKTRLALAAKLYPYVTVIESPGHGAIPIGNTWTRKLFGGPCYLSEAASPERTACSLVFVQSRDGNTVVADPEDLGGGDTDKHLIYEGLSRVAADAVLAGAATVRGSGQVLSVWHPELVALRASLGLPRHPIQIVATLRGIDLDETMMFNVPQIPVVLLAATDAVTSMRPAIAARPWVRTVTMDSPRGLPGAFAQLLSMGIARISCIGGRALAGRLLDARLVDDVYLTTGARDGGEPGTPLYDKDWRGRIVVRKHGTGPEKGVVFEHLRTVRGTEETWRGSRAR